MGKTIYNKLRKDIGKYLRRLYDYQGVEIIEANACSDYIHMNRSTVSFRELFNSVTKHQIDKKLEISE